MRRWAWDLTDEFEGVAAGDGDAQGDEEPADKDAKGAGGDVAEFFGDEAGDFETRPDCRVGEGTVANRGAHQHADTAYDPVLKRTKIQRAGFMYEEFRAATS